MNTSLVRNLLLVSSLFFAFQFDLCAAETGFDSNLEERMGRLERILNNQSGSDLVLKLQQLQTEIQELRGLLEAQQLVIAKLERLQRDQYLDIDSRLSATPAVTAAVTEASSANEPTPASATTVPANKSGVPSLPLPETLNGNEREAYSAAFSLLKERQYEQAKTAFSALLQSYPQGEFTDSARYWLGETYYVQRNYPAALEAFHQLIQNHPNSAKVASAMLRIGYIQFDQKAFEQAKASLEQVIASFPNSTEARLARSRLERISN